MPLVPILFRDWWEDCWDTPLQTSRLMDQHFGSGLTADDLLTALTSAAAACSALQQTNPRVGYNRPWRNSSLASRQDSGSTVNMGSDKFQINLDVQQFSPNEISVKAIDNSILVEGKHEEKQDEHGFISRHFVRRYVLPSGHDPEAIVSSLSSDGILTITAPKRALLEPEAARTIPITQTGQPMKKITEKPKEEKQTEKPNENK
ncbi:protein lethal(2)essential for life-like [Wyeomyia smithii]|uniref:protein lethal(2)essential for life-like n=1 Tax=Wyeomyia smithii TaxID=174621 RepID=UPI002467D28C|nr:protein lethal(2)essential for life-like [Wyeomyia smithii]